MLRIHPCSMTEGTCNTCLKPLEGFSPWKNSTLWHFWKVWYDYLHCICHWIALHLNVHFLFQKQETWNFSWLIYKQHRSYKEILLADVKKGIWMRHWEVGSLYVHRKNGSIIYLVEIKLGRIFYKMGQILCDIRPLF